MCNWVKLLCLWAHHFFSLSQSFSCEHDCTSLWWVLHSVQYIVGHFLLASCTLSWLLSSSCAFNQILWVSFTASLYSGHMILLLFALPMAFLFQTYCFKWSQRNLGLYFVLLTLLSNNFSAFLIDFYFSNNICTSFPQPFNLAPNFLITSSSYLDLHLFFYSVCVLLF